MEQNNELNDIQNKTSKPDNDKELIDLAFKMISYQEKQDIYTDSSNSIFAPYQLSVKYAVHPMSDKHRFLVNHSTGSGKTLTSLLVAKNFLNYNLKVFVITFNQSQFEKELQTIPELGFLSHSEVKLIESYPEMRDEIYRKIQKRIKSKISFIGYKELFIRIFTENKGVNMDYLNQFRGSLVICDEIHNIYNHYKKNIYGISIQFLSCLMGKNIYFLYLSATPLSYSKELGALLNIMQVNEEKDIKIHEFLKQLAANDKLINETANSDDQSQVRNVQDQIEQLQSYLQKPYDLDDKQLTNTIKEILKDKVSFVPEIQKNFPRLDQMGQLYKVISNIVIYRCPVTQQFQDNMMQMVDYMSKDESFKDIILHHEYDIATLIKQLKRNNQALIQWAKTLNISINKGFLNDTLTGPFLQVDQIGNYSPKLQVLMQYLLTVENKSFIYINNIQGFGVDLVCELLKVNGILLFDKPPTGSSICFKCKQMFRNHTTNVDVNSGGKAHQFVPYRAIVITGQNINQGDEYLKRFNKIENIVNQTYQIVIGSIKMKEGYNVLGVNNAFILSLPYNFTNYIQVIGRCVRNKSHFDLPVDQQYVRNYFLVHASKDAHSYDSDNFQDLMNNRLKSQFYGKITREELELWNKSLDFKLVQQYESIIHGVSIDTKYFYPIYFQTKESTPGYLEVSSTNQLKMLPFQFEVPSSLNKPIENIWEQNLDTFYLLDVASSINNSITKQIKKLLKAQSIWDIDKLIQTILKVDQAPNISIVPTDLIKQKIFTTQDVFVVDNFVIYSRHQPQLDFFLNSQLSTPIVSINITKQQETPIDPSTIVSVYKYLEEHFKPYTLAISQKKILKPSIKMQVTSQHTQNIYKMLNSLFQNVSLTTIHQLYKSEIVKYNQQMNANYIQKAHYIAVLNLILPFVYESSSNLNKQSSISKSKMSETEDNNTLIINGFLLDIHSQVYIHPNGDYNEISVQREKTFTNQIGLFKLNSQQFKLQDLSQLQEHKNIQQKIGTLCTSNDKSDIINNIEKKGQKVEGIQNKEQLCTKLQLLYMQEYFHSVLHFHQYFNFLFQFN